MRREHLDQAMTSVTVFRLGEDGDIAAAKRDDTVTLTGSGEVFKIGSKILIDDEFKTRIVVTPVLP